MPPRFRPAPLVLTDLQKKQPHQNPGDAARQVTSLYSWSKVLGSGTYGVVKEALRNSDGSLVAVKQVYHGGDEAIESNTRQEYELQRTLEHEFIVSVYEINELPSASWLCMELCEDGSLSSCIEREGALSEFRMLHLSKQLVSGLSFLHTKRVVHRDIKPENLLLKNAAHMKICDFGCATRIGNSEFCSVMLTRRGTGLYLAPEVLLDKTWNERVDVWACGLTCYFMSQASLPFDVNHSAVKQRFVIGSSVALKWRQPVSDLVQQFVAHCLTVDPKLRPSTLELAQQKIFAKETQVIKRRQSEQCLGRKAVTSFDVFDL
eukprot:TRINITY_DN56858_c0_g1_i1.p1 TRINITY_DN56858_c0_g1~~TRINITY_DN56858_c0_g1_i1.p1  ORF type:complete len:319 (+),score=44.88 TRINITY_DN56858_c0_g1_i1:2-958(+)